MIPPISRKIMSASLLLATLSLGGLTAIVWAQSAENVTVNQKLQLFRQHSIFSRDPMRWNTEDSSSERNRHTSYQPVSVAPNFNGVLADHAEFQAFLEDPQTGKISLVKVGQQLAQGKIEEITLDYLTLRTTDGKSKKILLGQTLSGEYRSSSGFTSGSYSSPATTAPGSSTEGNPPPAPGMATPGGPPAPTIVDMSDPIERMKAKRRAEMQGKR